MRRGGVSTKKELGPRGGGAVGELTRALSRLSNLQEGWSARDDVLPRQDRRPVKRPIWQRSRPRGENTMLSWGGLRKRAAIYRRNLRN